MKEDAISSYVVYPISKKPCNVNANRTPGGSAQARCYVQEPEIEFNDTGGDGILPDRPHGLMMPAGLFEGGTGTTTSSLSARLCPARVAIPPLFRPGKFARVPGHAQKPAFPAVSSFIHCDGRAKSCEASRMELDVQHIEVWQANITDQAGGLAHAPDVLDDAGVDIQFIVVGRGLSAQGRGQALATPLCGDHQVAAAAHAGFHIPEHIHTLRVSGSSRTGLVAGPPGMIALLGINLQGFAASTFGHEFVAYITADLYVDGDRIVQSLRHLQ